MANNIRYLREQKGLTQSELGKIFGLSKTAISLYETGRRGLDSELAKAIAEYFGVTTNEILYTPRELALAEAMRAQKNRMLKFVNSIESTFSNSELIPIDESAFILLPVYGKIAAGEPITAIQNIEEYMPMDTRFFNMNGHTKEDFFFLRIKGNSMEPTIMDNDLVLIRRQPIVENNEIAAVICNREDATVKRITVTGDKIILNSDNKEKPPMIFNASDCQIIGKVIKKIGDVR